MTRSSGETEIVRDIVKVDRTIPVWAIAGWLALQLLGGLWWAASMNERTDTLEKEVVGYSEDHASIRAIDARTSEMSNTLRDMSQRMDRRDGR